MSEENLDNKTIIVDIHDLSSVDPKDFTDEQKKELKDIIESWQETCEKHINSAEEDLKYIQKIVRDSIQRDKEYKEKNKIKE